ncbi:integrase core domain-containing protein [Xanthovirga aplysinae]|uniref:integrase core domain-containing protein n=1 Tax=Xanthovirga aplysinae TaxID=2529853 RepID=UPI001656F7D0|nr:integrase core domain-containing protein [Xanthovirga aplysinae]
MTESYDPFQNAIAERVNGILKQEFNIADGLCEHLESVKKIKESIMIYNQERPHLSSEYLTPNQMHNQHRLKPKSWKKKPSKTNALKILDINLN